MVGHQVSVRVVLSLGEAKVTLFQEPNTNYRYEKIDGTPIKTFREFVNYHYSFSSGIRDWEIAYALFDAFIAWVDRPETNHDRQIQQSDSSS